MSILKAFTSHLIEFANDIEAILPNDSNIRTSKFFLVKLAKINPRSIIVGWKECVNEPYKKYIDRGDFDYFINKDYKTDLNGNQDRNQILGVIDSIRSTIKNMGNDNKKKSMKYVQNLTKLCDLYFAN